jgi:hypothetical protein
MGQVLGCDGPRYDRDGRELNTPREAGDVDEVVIKDKDGEIVRAAARCSCLWKSVSIARF